MRKRFELTFGQIKAIDDAFRGLNNLYRWTEFNHEIKFNELSKQALNCIITFSIATYTEKKYGKKIRWDRFPKLALRRMFQKMGLSDVTSSTYYSIVVDKMGKGIDEYFEAVGNHIIKMMVCDEFISEELINFLNESENTFEEKVFKVSSRIATLIEVQELETEFAKPSDYAEKYHEILEDIKKMSKDIPAVNDVLNSSIYPVFQDISRKLRNQNRWAVRGGQVHCAVLGHLFDTAVFAYFMSLQQGDSEEVAAKMFFMGIWHDVPEAWTKDIPSPTKDAFPGFREASEEYELDCINRNIYNVVDTIMKDAIKSVMMEDESAKPYKPLIKAADYLSADSECYRQLVAGTRDKYFRNVVWKDINAMKEGKNRLDGVFKDLVCYYYEQIKDLKLLG